MLCGVQLLPSMSLLLKQLSKVKAKTSQMTMTEKNHCDADAEVDDDNGTDPVDV
jgi:hypothetical protein